MNHFKSRATGFAIAALGLCGLGTVHADNSPLRIGILSPSTGASAYSGLSFEQAARQMLEPYVRNGRGVRFGASLRTRLRPRAARASAAERGCPSRSFGGAVRPSASA